MIDQGEAVQTRLMRLGIPDEWYKLLTDAGVKPEEELAESNGKELFERLNRVNEEKKLVRKTPTLTQVEGWVKKAKREVRKNVK